MSLKLPSGPSLEQIESMTKEQLIGFIIGRLRVFLDIPCEEFGVMDCDNTSCSTYYLCQHAELFDWEVISD